MTILCAFAILAIAGLASDRPAVDDDARRDTGRPKWIALVLAACGLLLALAASDALAYAAALAQRPSPAWLAGAPLLPILELQSFGARTPPVFSIAAEGLALLEVALLGVVAYALHGAARSRSLGAFFGAFALASIALAAFARGTTSTDLYAYAFYAANGLASYHTLEIAPNGPLAIVGHLLSFHMLPAPYGPLWLVVAHAVAGAPGNLVERLFELRMLSALSLGAVLLALVALRVPATFLGLVALDPVFGYQYVADGHNDLAGIALLLWGMVAARRGWLVPAVALVALAGATKASFLVLGPLAFVDAGSLRQRATASALAAAGAVALSFSLGGPAYPHAIDQIAHAFPVSVEPGGAIVPRATTLLAVLLVAGAVLFRRTGWPGAWAFVSLGSIPFPWYLVLGLPYAALDPRRAIPFLVAFPIAAYVTSTAFAPTVAWWPLAIAVPVCAALLAWARWRPIVRGDVRFGTYEAVRRPPAGVASAP